ncbi:MAG: multiheme c-type cytochrome, partial [Phycisphaerales bacterium]
FANEHRMNLGAVKWVVGEDYSAAPTCATCHMSATPTMAVTHNVGQRISWNNRPAVSIRPEIADAAAGLPGAHIPWQQRRQNMTNVCLSCHDPNYVDGFYVQYDGLVDLYNSKFGEPGQRLYDLARPLLQPSQFSNPLDFIWFDLWHREGRRARHGAAMMGPAYAYSSGMYEVARRFYSEFVPELRRLAAEARVSDDPRQVPAGEALQAALDEVLASDDHKWFLGRMDPDEAARRRRATKDSALRSDK